MALPPRSLGVAISEHRSLNGLCSRLEAAGASIQRFGLVSFLDPPDAGPIRAWLARLAAGSFDVVVFLSEEGVERLFDAATGLGMTTELHLALAGRRIITRGPVPARALGRRQVRAPIRATPPTQAGMLAALREAALAGQRVGVQLQGGEGNSADLVAWLQRSGATVDAVSPYIVGDGQGSLAALAEALGQQRLDAVVFATSSQVDRLLSIARERGDESRLRAGLARVHVGAIGSPIVAYLRRLDIRVDCGPTCRLLELQLPPSLVKRGQAAAP